MAAMTGVAPAKGTVGGAAEAAVAAMKVRPTCALLPLSLIHI